MSISTSEYPVQDVIKNRWTRGAFSDKPVPAEVLRKLVRAARWHPPATTKTWAFPVAKGRTRRILKNSLGALVEFNRLGEKGAVLVMRLRSLLAKTKAPQPECTYDVGRQSLQLALEATARGLVVQTKWQAFWIRNRRERGVRNSARLGSPLAAMAIGYPGDMHLLCRSRIKLGKLRGPQTNPRICHEAGQWGPYC